MGMIFGMGVIGLLILSLLLSYLTPFGFWQSSLTILAILGGLAALNSLASWFQDQKIESSAQLSSQLPPGDELPSWSRSNFAVTKAIKLSPETPPKHLDPDYPFEQEGFLGYAITYPNSETSRFFVNQHYFNQDNQYVQELRYWNGQIDQLAGAPQLKLDDDADRLEAFGIDEDWTLLRIEYFKTFKHQLYLLDHRTDTLTPLTERMETVAASQGVISDSHYYTAICQEPKQLLLTLYSRSKNYDSFFSARGHYLPRDSKIFLINEPNPEAQLIAHLRLSKEGLVVGLAHKEKEILIHAIDEREIEQPTSRYWSFSLEDAQ